MTMLFGIPNSDSVGKAHRWLDAAGIAYRFHDFRKDGLTEEIRVRWVRADGWETPLNRHGTTCKRLPPAEGGDLDETALALMAANPTPAKRPLLEPGDQVAIGFSADRYADLCRIG